MYVYENVQSSHHLHVSTKAAKSSQQQYQMVSNQLMFLLLYKLSSNTCNTGSTIIDALVIVLIYCPMILLWADNFTGVSDSYASQTSYIDWTVMLTY